MRAIAILFLLYGVWKIVWGLVLLYPFFWAPVAITAKFDAIASPAVQYVLPPAQVMLGAFAVLAGVGLLRRAEWARPTATLMATVSLLFVPAGTVFGAVALWLLSRAAQAEEVSAAPAPSASA